MRGQNTGRGQGRRGMGGGRALGPGGECVCPQCGYTVQHQLGTPCFKMKCPKCGILLVRK